MTNEIMTEFGPNINERTSPCSTFKITLSLIGYDAGILKDEKTPTWDFQEGYDDWLPTWKACQSPESWMKSSCVWYSKILALQLGMEKIQSYLNTLEYGNRDISGGIGLPGPAGVAWINSSLKITLREQVDFIQKMVLRKLPLASEAIKKTRAILFREELGKGWKLFGKTGGCVSKTEKDGQALEQGWFIGWIEKDQNFYPFAYLIRGNTIKLSQRILRVKQLLLESGTMN